MEACYSAYVQIKAAIAAFIFSKEFAIGEYRRGT